MAGDLLIQIGCFISDPDRSKWPCDLFAGKRFIDITNEVESLVAQYLRDHDVDHPDARVKTVSEAIAECREIGRERNRLVHSFYLHLEAGGSLVGMLRSKMMPAKPQAGQSAYFEQANVTEESFEVLLNRIGRVGLILGQLHLQLIHWHGSVTKK